MNKDYVEKHLNNSQYMVRFSDTQRKLFLYFNKNNKNIEKEITYKYTINNSTICTNDNVKITDFQLSIDNTHHITKSDDIITYIKNFRENNTIVLSATKPNSKTKKL